MKSSRKYQGLCPFHSERTPSFTDMGVCHCFGCGAHETASGYQMRVYGQSFIEAVKALARRAGVDLSDYVGRAEKPKAAPKPKIANRADEGTRETEAEKRRRLILRSFGSGNISKVAFGRVIGRRGSGPGGD
ncbi:CHC2 zinc finger domain-containing protein [Thalassospiraceae bacterium SW-3-3]|nr:CHC2 zinc finger domain-containing protein [Thalassospiraceae bacterium SW-3-3]